MAEIQLAILGASRVGPNGSPLWTPSVPIGNDVDDVSGVGEVPAMQSLGVTSFPYPKDASGYAECLYATGVGGRDAVCFAAWDTRSAAIVGKGEPGDTFVHSTGPSLAAQLLLKERKRQAVLTTTARNGDRMALVLDGKNEKLQMLANGAMIQIDDEGGISLLDSTGKGIRIVNGQINLIGTVVLGGGLANPALSIMLGPVTGSPGGPTSVPMVAAPGVFIGL